MRLKSIVINILSKNCRLTLYIVQYSLHFIISYTSYLYLYFFYSQSGKVTFSYIYGIGVMGCIFFYCLLSLMVSRSQVTFGAVASVLGYCLLPMVVLSGINILITIQ